ncbi:MAG: hypothetical protein GY926_06760, partial [bacterium]|nr:hypothetical protein [bacterium]
TTTRNYYTFAGQTIGYATDNGSGNGPELTTTATGHLGSTEITNNTTTGVTRQTYLPYGGTRNSNTNGLDTDHTYTGQTDDSLGWMHSRARQYDPTLARFLQADTITTDGLNRYAYVRNNPTNGTDPTGRCTLISGDLWCNGKNFGQNGSGYATEYPGRGGGGHHLDVRAYHNYREAGRWSGNSGGTAPFWSFVADMAPGVGDSKGIVEFFTGNDVITGDDLAWWERGLGLFLCTECRRIGGAVGDLLGGGKHLDEALDTVDEVPTRPTPTTIPSPSGGLGFTDDTVSSAFQGMRNDGGHASRHLVDAGLIANSGPLVSRVDEFVRITTPMLTNPAKTFDWRLGNTATRAFAGDVSGTPVVVFVAKDGPYQGVVVSAVVPDTNQIAQWGL